MRRLRLPHGEEWWYLGVATFIWWALESGLVYWFKISHDHAKVIAAVAVVAVWIAYVQGLHTGRREASRFPSLRQADEDS